MTRLPEMVPNLYPTDLPALSPRELEVVRLLARRLSTREIAGALSISISTVRSRVRNALPKLDVGERTDAAGAAHQRGLI